MEESHAQATASFAAVTARGRAVTANRAICAIRASGFAPRQRVTYYWLRFSIRGGALGLVFERRLE